MIRLATSADLDRILAVERRGFSAQDAYGRRQLAHLLSPKARALVLVDEEAGALRGHLILLWRSGSRVARVYDLVVDPVHRRAGIARALLAAAEAGAGDRGMTLLSVETRESNALARRVYEASGFTVHERLPSYYGENQPGLRMRKRVSPPATIEPGS